MIIVVIITGIVKCLRAKQIRSRATTFPRGPFCRHGAARVYGRGLVVYYVF
jgi:hypothetical protein